MAAKPTESFEDGLVLHWRGPLTDDEMVDLVSSYGVTPVPGWWDQIRPHSYGWVTARTHDGSVVGFVNVVTDGGDHAFLIDTKTRGVSQRQQVGWHSRCDVRDPARKGRGVRVAARRL